MNKQEVIEGFLKKNYLVSPDFFEEYDDEQNLLVNLKENHKPLVINKDLLVVLRNNEEVVEINWIEFEKSKVLLEKGKDGKIYQNFLDILFYNINIEKKHAIDSIVEEIKKPEMRVVIEKEKNDIANVVVTYCFNRDDIEEKDVTSFVNHFKFRYNDLKDILVKRTELANVISISKAKNRIDKSVVAIIGMVQDKRVTQNGNLLLSIEDPTGVISVLFNKNKNESYNQARDLVLDEVIGVIGNGNGDIIFGERICLPDIPISKEIKRVSDDVCVAFISDIHIGSNKFLEEKFLRFINWLNLKDKKDKDFAEKIKYLFIVGDLVDGVGVFPGQFDVLSVKDINQQYDLLAKYLSMIREDIRIIICPGDHDALRLAHPQPSLDKKIASKVWDLKNVVLVSNPGMVNIHASKNFPGFDVLMYHGHGYHYYHDAVESLRGKDSTHNPRYIMQFLLQRRHLAPTHTSTIYVPDNKNDFMVIKKIPDIFVSGHLHKSDVSSYNNVVTINCSCWQSQTDFQVKVGNFPDPCKVPIMNLKSGKIEVLDFDG